MLNFIVEIANTGCTTIIGKDKNDNSIYNLSNLDYFLPD